MQRSVEMSRIYRLGDFENLSVKDSLINIESIMELPDNIALDEELLKKVQYLQMVRIELMAYKYYDLRRKFKDLSLDDSIKVLENLNTQLNIGLKEHLTATIENYSNEKAKGD